MSNSDLNEITLMDENDFVIKHSGLVQSILHTLPLNRIKEDTGLEREDLESVGLTALIKAKRKFNPDYGFRFSTYAVPFVRGEMLRHIIINGKVHVPRPVRNAYTKIAKADMFTEPDEVISETLGMELIHVKRAKSFDLNVSSLHREAVGDQGDTYFIDLLSSNVDVADIAESNLTIKEFLSTLSRQERRVWDAYKETNCGNQSTISEMVGVGQPQTGRILRRIFAKAEKFGEKLRTQ